MNKTSVLIVLIVLASNLTVFGQTDRNLERDKAGARTGKSMALVIRNGAYQKAKTLPNPANDAADMAVVLKEVEFEVFSGTVLNKRHMQDLIRDFVTRNWPDNQ